MLRVVVRAPCAEVVHVLLTRKSNSSGFNATKISRDFSHRQENHTLDWLSSKIGVWWWCCVCVWYNVAIVELLLSRWIFF